MGLLGLGEGLGVGSPGSGGGARGWVSRVWGRGWGLGLLQPFPFTPTEQRKRYSTEVMSDFSTNAVNVSLGSVLPRVALWEERQA